MLESILASKKVKLLSKVERSREKLIEVGTRITLHAIVVNNNKSHATYFYVRLNHSETKI